MSEPLTLEQARAFLSTVPGIADTPENMNVLLDGLSDAAVVEVARQTSRFVAGQIFVEMSEEGN